MHPVIIRPSGALSAGEYPEAGAPHVEMFLRGSKKSGGKVLPAAGPSVINVSRPPFRQGCACI